VVDTVGVVREGGNLGWVIGQHDRTGSEKLFG
jgi:hypothetical protein